MTSERETFSIVSKHGDLPVAWHDRLPALTLSTVRRELFNKLSGFSRPIAAG
jgi:hypothetical protein